MIFDVLLTLHLSQFGIEMWTSEKQKDSFIRISIFFSAYDDGVRTAEEARFMHLRNYALVCNQGEST